ncbi:hypothetical protein OSO01_32940 [Oceanobacillus sojae]|uniref:Uncharacterized protein n=1 Tax=Oceanobacillus sojae TaxID=582851 RepID=A0A511ZM80_9BACI|nr:hypothetical protein OSO01_32940 [Oceanobacillus sojae]
MKHNRFLLIIIFCFEVNDISLMIIISDISLNVKIKYSGYVFGVYIQINIIHSMLYWKKNKAGAAYDKEAIINRI